MKTAWLISFLLVLTPAYGFSDHECPEASVADKIAAKVESASSYFKNRGYISAEELNSLSSRQIGERIVQRIHAQCDHKRGSNEGVPLETDSDITMFVPSAVLDGVEKYGFQNQHVTRTTKGCDCRESRYQREVEFPGLMIGYGPKAKEVLPKYSALNVTRKSNIGIVTPADQYGDTIFVFKPAVKKRTTWTQNDSLGDSPFRGSAAANTLKFKDKKTDPFKCSGYCEAQIWGALDLSDVEYVMIKPGAMVPEVLKRNKIPVYFSKSDSMANSSGYTKGALAFEGSSKRKIASIDEKVQTPAFDPKIYDISQKIIQHKNMSRQSSTELIQLYNHTSTDFELKREIVGQLALSKEVKVKAFMMQVARDSRDSLTVSQVFLHLASHGKDPAVRKIFLDHLKDTSYGKKRSATQMALAIILENDGFKQDKDLQAALKTRIDNDEILKRWYQRLQEQKSICPPQGDASYRTDGSDFFK